MIDPRQTPVILWKHRTLANAYTLRIANQRLTGFIRTDRQGQLYWKFQVAKSKPAPLPTNLAQQEEITTHHEPDPNESSRS